MEPYDAAAMPDEFAASRNLFDVLAASLLAPESDDLTHAELEELCVIRGREVLRQLLQDRLDLGAIREERRLQAAPPAGRVEKDHRRLLATVVGTVTVRRCAIRSPGRRNRYPADEALALPASRYSAGLAALAVTESVRGSFDTAHVAITSRCGNVIGKRQIEDQVAQAAADIDAFYAWRTPLPRTAGDLLVISCDAKGIVMRPDGLRAATAKAAAAHQATFRTRLASGEKPHRKRICAARRSVIFPVKPGGTRREVPGSDG